MRVGLAIVAAVAALVASGCGGGDTSSIASAAKPKPPRSPYVEALAALCTRRLQMLEKIGGAEAPDQLVVKLPRQNAALSKFLDGVRALKPSASEKKASANYTRFFATYLDGQVYALRVIRSGSFDGYFTVVESALYWQKQAERVALRLGATECARRPRV